MSGQLPAVAQVRVEKRVLPIQAASHQADNLPIPVRQSWNFPHNCYVGCTLVCFRRRACRFLFHIHSWMMNPSPGQRALTSSSNCCNLSLRSGCPSQMPALWQSKSLWRPQAGQVPGWGFMEHSMFKCVVVRDNCVPAWIPSGFPKRIMDKLVSGKV